MRALAVIAVAMALALAACGDDSGEEAGTSRQATTGTTEPSAPEGATGDGKTQTTTRGEGGVVETPQRKKSNSQTGGTAFPAGERGTYRRSKAICGSGRPRKIGREYGIESRNPYEVALAYSKEAARPSERDAAYAGCLAGFGFQPAEPVKTGAAKFPPSERTIYRLGKRKCGAGTPRKIGREYGVKGENPYKVALAYSKKAAQPSARDAAYVGCLAGFGIG